MDHLQRSWLALAALLGLCGVAAGALGAHLVGDPARAQLLVTATGFALPHAASLVGLAALTGLPRYRGWPVAVAGGLIAAGAVLFCGALWIHGLSGRSLGPMAPTGGTLLMLGWLLLLPAALLAHDRERGR